MEKLVMDRISCHVTAKCNLRCKKCAVYIPKLYDMGNVPEYDIGDIKKSFKTYFNLVDHVRLISLTGGEPMLYPHLAELILNLMQYKQSFSKLEVFTNGAVSITKPILEALSKSEKTVLFIDHYGSEISNKIDEIEKSCKEFNIQYTVRKYYGDKAHLGGWVDRSILSKKLGIETAKMHFSKCAASKKGGRLYTIFGKEIVFCATPYCGYRIGALPKSDVLSIDLCEDSSALEEKYEKLVELDNMDFNPGCAWCNGMGVYENVERFMPGEQVNNHE